MKRYRHWIIAAALLLILIVLIKWSSSQTAMVPRASQAWSRGQVIGRTSLRRHVALHPAPDGGVFLVWHNVEEQLELAHIGQDGEVLLDRVLSVGAGQARDPQLEVDPGGRLSLLWREGDYPRSVVHYVSLETDGTPAASPQALSDPARPALDPPRLALDAQGNRHAIWADEAGIQWAVLRADGTLLREPTLLAPEGRFPDVRWGSRGQLHLIWQRQEVEKAQPLYYAVLDPESGLVEAPVEIAQVFLRTGQRLGEPAIALTPETCYVFWWVQDFKYVISQGEYALFPLTAPEQGQVVELRLQEGKNPATPYPLQDIRTPVLVALSVSVPDAEVAGTDRSQISVVTLKGDAIGEQIVTASTQASLKPVLITDERSHLHLAWLETAEFGQYRVVYASTAPDVMANYNTLTLLDTLDAVLSNVFRLSMVVVTAWAVVILWAILPLVGLLVYHLVTGEETLDTVRSRVALGAALALEIGLSFAMPPTIGVQASWPALRWVAPAAVAVMTTLITVRVLRRRRYTNLFTAFFLFTAVNSVLQMVLYLLF